MSPPNVSACFSEEFFEVLELASCITAFQSRGLLATLYHCASSLGKGRFDQLNRERRVHLLQPLVMDGRGVTGTADEGSLCSWFEFVVGLSLCSTQFSLVVS